MDADSWEQADFLHKLKFLLNQGGERKLRLYVCACCRRLWHLLTDERGRRAIEVGEEAADGLAPPGALDALAFAPEGASPADATAALAAFWIVSYSAGRVSEDVEQVLAGTVADHDVDPTAFWKAYRVEGAVTERLLRDLLGNPFRPVSREPAWLTWNDAAVVRIARGIYEERAYDLLPVLADALEEAGCTNADILAHCRAPGLHVRGCWVVDLILGKQ